MATEICVCYNLKDRIKILTKYIELAKECQVKGAFNTVFALVTGLSNSSIARLKNTWSVRFFTLLFKKTNKQINK